MRSMKLIGAIMAVVIGAALILGSCAKTTTTTTTSTKATTSTVSTTATAQKEPYGDLNVAVATFDRERWDPPRTALTEIHTFVVPMFDSLIRLKGEKLAPGVADSWELAPDGLSWVFKLHKGIKFSNGDPLTAADVKFSYERYSAKEATFTTIAEAVERTEIIDDYTIRFVTKGPQPYLPTYVSFFSPAYGAIQPKNYIGKNGVEYFAQNPIGAGPWKMVKHVPGDRVEFEAVENHWRQTPAFKKLNLLLVPEDATRNAMLQSGAADVIDVSIEGGRALATKGFNVQAISSMQATVMLVGAFGAESAKLPIYDVRVRQALSYAINRQEIQKGFLYGKGTPALPGLLVVEAADDVDIPYWQAQAEKLYAKYDTAEAKRLLAEAGYPAGFNIKIWQNTMGSGEYLPKIAEIVAGYWGAIGVKTELVPSDWGTTRPVANVINVPNSPARGNAVMMRLIPRPTMKTMFVSMINTKGTVALLGNSFPEEDQLETAIGTELNAAKRRQLVTQVVQRLADSWVALPIGGVPVTAAIGPRVDFVFPPATSNIMTYSDTMKHGKVK